MTGCGRLARVDVANDDDVDVGLLLWHGDAFVQQMRKKIMRMGFDFNRRTPGATIERTNSPYEILYK